MLLCVYLALLFAIHLTRHHVLKLGQLVCDGTDIGVAADLFMKACKYGGMGINHFSHSLFVLFLQLL